MPNNNLRLMQCDIIMIYTVVEYYNRNVIIPYL